MSTINRERIDLRLEAETKQLAEHKNLELSNAQFDRFTEVCIAQHTVPPRLKQAAELLDKEGF